MGETGEQAWLTGEHVTGVMTSTDFGGRVVPQAGSGQGGQGDLWGRLRSCTPERKR